MKYNKLGQGYTVLRHFTLQPFGREQESYTEVLFNDTKHKQVVRTETIHTGDFEDLLLKVMLENEAHEEFCKDEEFVVTLPAEEPSVSIVEEINNAEETMNDGTTGFDITGEVVFEDLGRVILVDPPQGDVEEVAEADLEAYCVEHDLDVEAVRNVLEGKAKTHKKYKFTYKN